MRANGETDALKVLAINPLGFIVFPRMIAGVVSVVCLVFYFDVIALFGFGRCACMQVETLVPGVALPL